jgi:hypothetical protein
VKFRVKEFKLFSYHNQDEEEQDADIEVLNTEELSAVLDE